MKMHEEYYVTVRQSCDERDGNDRWRNVTMWDNTVKTGQRYYRTIESAQKALKNAYNIWNGKKVYDANGKRTKLVDSINGIGVSIVSSKEDDDRLRIVKHRIQKRMVTEWETIEEK